MKFMTGNSKVDRIISTGSHMAMRIIFVLFFFASTVCSQDFINIDPVVSGVLAKPIDAAQQRALLRLIPKFVEQRRGLELMVKSLRLELLDSSDCQLLTRTALEIDHAYKLTRVGRQPSGHGGVIDPDFLITFRLKQLILEDAAEFDKSQLMNTSLASENEFWSSFAAWIDKHGITSPQAKAMKDELARYRSEINVFQVNPLENRRIVPYLLPNSTMEAEPNPP